MSLSQSKAFPCRWNFVLVAVFSVINRKGPFSVLLIARRTIPGFIPHIKAADVVGRIIEK